MLTNVISRYKIFLPLIYLSIFLLFTFHDCFAHLSVEGIQLYHKNMHLSPEHKQKLADDIRRYRHADNLWDVLREEFTLPHYEDNPAVQQKIEWYMNNQDYLLRSANRAAPYLYYILQQVRKRHLPAELVLLPIVESGYNPFNRSPVGAAGIWQLMPGTAAGFGVKQDSLFDGRRDMIASTRAALYYLSYLQSFFDGNWLLAIAAYNTGEGNVQTALKKNIRNGLDTDFWSLPVAQETRDYVPSLLALAIIISHPEEYPVYFPPVRNAPYLAQVDIGSRINFKYAASLAGISYKKLMQLNSGFTKLSTSTKDRYKLILPIENVEQFTENLARSPLNQPLHWLHYKVKTGDTLASIAKKFKTNIHSIQKMNHLAKSNLYPGINLLIPNPNGAIGMENEEFTPQTVVASKKNNRKNPVLSRIKQSSRYLLRPGDTVYMVRPKDSFESIARRFHVNPRDIRLANRLHQRMLTAGKQIIIPTHPIPITQTATIARKKQKIMSGDTIYMVRRGDTIEKIARKFHTSPSSVRLTNLVDNDSLIEGEKLIIPTHLKA